MYIKIPRTLNHIYIHIYKQVIKEMYIKIPRTLNHIYIHIYKQVIKEQKHARNTKAMQVLPYIDKHKDNTNTKYYCI